VLQIVLVFAPLHWSIPYGGGGSPARLSETAAPVRQMSPKSVSPAISATLSALESLLSGDRTWAYAKAEIPTEIDARLTELISTLVGLSIDERTAIGDHLTRKVGGGLRVFAIRMATSAVRTGDSQEVLLGLRALALHTDPDDPRDIFVAVAPLWRASELIGAPAQALFDEAAAFTASEVSGFIRTFPRRAPEGRRLADFGFHEEGAGATFRFVSDAPSVDDPNVRALLGDLWPGDESVG